jgi:hypothetical protein
MQGKPNRRCPTCGVTLRPLGNDRFACVCTGDERAEYGYIEARHVDDVLPTGCYHCLERIAGRTRALCPSHGDEWMVG